MIRDCGYTTVDDQRLQTYYRRWPETADILQEMARDCGCTTGMTRDCRCTTGDDQRLQTYCRI
ncbi:unnamed protein product [Staurois parvus]|uniref:Uncharacterized protein n=1 Tax=Staurois parvus TaxID=386267 RepID=A0ABN9CKI9_9NEOB|nr:unnamed protein product [Staurois parvus]